METLPFLRGLGLGASLIAAIGAQNMFVLTQAIRREHHLVVGLVCFLCDSLLISLGVFGVGAAVAGSPVLKGAAACGGVIFLAWFGCTALRSAMRSGSFEAGAGRKMSLGAALATGLAVSLLNPHAWLDTVVMLGGMSASFHGPNRSLFGLGAVTASFVWFLSLSLGGQALAPLFRRPSTWRVLDGLVAVTVWTVAAALARDAWPLD